MAVKQIVNKNFKFSVTQMGVNRPGITSGGSGDVLVQESGTAQAGGGAVLVEKITQDRAALQWGCEGPTKNTTAVTEVFSGGFSPLFQRLSKPGPMENPA